LKDQHYATRKLLLHPHEHVRGSKQHRGMRIMSARMHSPFDFRGEREAASFTDRQRIHIGSQRGYAPRRAAVDAGDYTGSCDPSVLDFQRIELPLDERRCFVLFETKFRPAMDGASQLDYSRDQRFVYLHCHRGRC
jgi:hypothetical protein